MSGVVGVVGFGPDRFSRSKCVLRRRRRIPGPQLDETRLLKKMRPSFGAVPPKFAFFRPPGRSLLGSGLGARLGAWGWARGLGLGSGLGSAEDLVQGSGLVFGWSLGLNAEFDFLDGRVLDHTGV